MHLLRVDTISLDEGEAAVDLGQEPGDIVFLSFTDSDLHGVARAHAEEPSLPSLRLAKLARLRHPMSVDLYVDAGSSAHGLASTVVDCAVPVPRLLREGAVALDSLEAAAGMRLRRE